MENPKNMVGDIIDDIKEYIDTSAELYKLQAAEKTATVVSSLAINLTLVLAGAFVVLFASIALAMALSSLFHAGYIGFLIVAGIYALILIVVAATKEKWLKSKLVDSIIKSMFEK